MGCPNCGVLNPPEADRCRKCDTPLPKESATLTSFAPSGWSAPAAEVVQATRPSELQPGTVLANRYEIVRTLGEGGMGAVYQARDRELDRMVALKIIRSELAGNAEILRRFKQELILARQVTHKNVIRIFDLGEVEGVKFITMEYIEGDDLRTLLRTKGKLPPSGVVNIMEQVCRALDAAHSEGVIHRDLKPQNIMVDKQGKVYVMDFGIARSTLLPGMTQTGALIGTPEYMSPEQAKGVELDARSDLFSLGIIFYELLTGKGPYQAETAMGLLWKRLQERARPPVELDSSIPRPLSDIVCKCLEADRDQRYASAAQLLEDLESLRGPRPGTRATPMRAAMNPAVRWVRYAPPVQKWIAVGAATLVLLISGFALRQKLPLQFSSKPKAAPPPVSLAILPFRNASGDPAMDWIGPSLAEMLRTDMGQSAQLRTVSSDRLHQILKDLRIPANTDFDPATLKRLAEFSNAETLVWGQYVKIGDRIRVDATLQDLKHQRSVPMKAEAPSEKEFLRAVGELAQNIQQNLALSPDVLKELRAKSFRPSSQSAQALRYYNEGLELSRQGKKMDAAKSFEAAVHEDPNFALAYSKLARTYADLGYDDKAEQFSRRSMELSDKLPEQERYLIQANHALILNDSKKAIESYENLAKVLPEDPEVHFNLGGMYESAGEFDKARAEYARVLERDPKQVDALTAAGRVEIRSGNPQGGLDYLSRALTLAIQLENDEERARILQAMGIAYKTLNKFDEALSNYQESLKIKRRLGQQSGIAASLNEIGQIQERLGKPDAALAAFQEALQVRRAIGDKKGIGNTLNDLGNFYVDRSRYDEALKLFKESLQIQRDVGDENYQALCLSNIGNTYLAIGDYENARTYFDQALVLREKFKVPQDMADTLHNLAETSVKMGQYGQALDQYLRALQLRRSAGDKRGAAVESYSMGTVFEHQGRYGAALMAKEEALKTFQDLQDRSFWMAEILSGYGHSLAQVGRYDDAQKSLEQALSLARALKNQALLAQTLNFQGDSFFYRNEIQSSKLLFEQALQESSRTSDRNLVLLSKINLAKVAVQQGNALMAIGSLKALAREAETTGVKYLSAECSVYLGQALLDLRQYAPARRELESAQRRSEKMGLKVLLAQSHHLLAQILARTGDAAGASLHAREARRLLEDIHTEAHTDAVLKRGDLGRIAAETGGHS